MAEVIRLFPGPSRVRRPMPPATMLDHENFDAPTFIPAPELGTGPRSTFRNSCGLPEFVVVGQDVEEFVGVVRRYGADATGGARALVEAVNATPTVAAAAIDAACGNCKR